MQITIGIPSYNEQANMDNLLRAVEKQAMREHEICEIIVSDDSTDCTPDVVNDFARNSRVNVTLVHHSGRRGGARAWNEIFDIASGDVVVLYDADVIPDGNASMMLTSSIKDDVALCAANPLPLKRRGMAARASTFNSSWLRQIRNVGLSQYTVMGRALSVRKDVARKITIPDIIAIDLYLQCKVLELGYGIDYRDDAVVWFKPASTMLDFTSQVARAVRGHREVKELVKKVNLGLPMSTFVKEVVKEMFRDPAGVFALALSYAALPVYMARIGDDISSSMWHVADSTKRFSTDDLQSHKTN